MIQAILGAALAAIVAPLAYRARALTLLGAAAAFAIGAIVFGSGGWRAAAVLFAFFIPSALISRIGAKRGPPRSGWQVLANGGVAAICALGATRGGSVFAAAFAGAFAAASADTWGTEIGTLSRTPPVSILTLRSVQAGRSGGVTALGSAATICGALCVALVASAVGVAPFWSVAAGGIAGALLAPRTESSSAPVVPEMRMRVRNSAASLRNADDPAARCRVAGKRRRQLCRNARGCHRGITGSVVA
ncbi:MAG TPA: DUF92 domain-containing protein [Candidatus Cybelea sp.]|nr:DUF92 domain-containing protein [Candidatus Cybelea sp.]